MNVVEGLCLEFVVFVVVLAVYIFALQKIRSTSQKERIHSVGLNGRIHRLCCKGIFT